MRERIPPSKKNTPNPVRHLRADQVAVAGHQFLFSTPTAAAVGLPAPLLCHAFHAHTAPSPTAVSESSALAPRPRPRRRPSPTVFLSLLCAPAMSLPNTCACIARPCTSTRVCAATPIPLRLAAASTLGARPVLPYATGKPNLARLPRRSLPNSCALPSRSAPFTAVVTVAAVIGRPAATALSAHLVAQAPHQIAAFITRPRPLLAEFRGGGVWARWIDVSVCALCMANVAAPRTTARPPAARVPDPIATLTTHSGFPSPSAASSLNHRSGVTTPPPSPPPELQQQQRFRTNPKTRQSAATASSSAPLPRIRQARGYQGACTLPRPHSTSTTPPLTTMAAAATPDHHAVRRVRIARLCGPAMSLPNTCTRIDSRCASARFCATTPVLSRPLCEPVPPHIHTASAPSSHALQHASCPASTRFRLRTPVLVSAPAPAPSAPILASTSVWAGHPAPQLRRITPTVHLVPALCPDPPPRGYAYVSSTGSRPGSDGGTRYA
ncbi:hypothetical protein DFH08DRAFT_979570 [Mycena albidolilacea]|uniref:Uncharacterized protein n=1 Tax=Mycena albidolilacea TaxID=1033008 RepID=A0AAD7E6G7_9AGAR|nr:hypothetical protein DFH08DRAFT_979570 [Mycena albidolilacea]